MSRTARVLAPLVLVAGLAFAAAPSAAAYPLPGWTSCTKTIIWKGRPVVVPVLCPPTRYVHTPRVAEKHRAVVVDHGRLAR